LEGKLLGPYWLLVQLGTKNRFGARYFEVFLKDSVNEISPKPVVIGLFHQGSYPDYNWIEIIRISLPSNLEQKPAIASMSPQELGRQLFRYLADLIPAGGHLMVEYDSPEQEETARSLTLGIPPTATPLRYLMLLVGCGAGFKDWYFSEGGSEGPRKLLGYKALNPEHAQRKIGEMVKALKAFLGKPPLASDSELDRAARKRAREILKSYD
jgi:hypothetical protein